MWIAQRGLPSTINVARGNRRALIAAMKSIHAILH
jgi:hypothetical protein